MSDYWTKVFGMSRQMVSDRWDCNAHGYNEQTPTIRHDRKNLLFYRGFRIAEDSKSRWNGLTETNELIRVENFPKLGTDGATFYTSTYIKAATRYKNSAGQAIAVQDVFGNIHIPYLQSEGRLMTEMIELIDSIWGNDAYLETFAKKLSNIPADLIKEIQITTEFDKEKWIEKAQNELSAHKDRVNLSETARANAQLNVLRDELAQTKIKLTQAGSNEFMAGLLLSGNPDWEVIDFGGIKCMKWKHKIFGTKIKGEGQIVNIPEKGLLYTDTPEKYKKVFIDGLTIPIIPKPEVGYYTSAWHVNCYSGKICLGSLTHKPLHEVLNKVVETMKMCNTDSAWDEGPAKRARKLLKGEEAEKLTIFTT